MSNLFDELQEGAFDVVTDTMGYDAAWGSFTGRVLFNQPTEMERLGKQTPTIYNDKTYIMEYREGVFPGLFEAVRASKQKAEKMTVNEIEYMVRKVEKKYDGKNYVATLEKL